MSKLWRLYKNCLAIHPVKTQIISSGVIWGFGDFFAQAITNTTAKKKHQLEGEEHEFNINWTRVAAISLFGFSFVGPAGHFWYEGLDRFLRSRLLMQPNTMRFVGARVALDGFLFGPLDLLVFFTFMGFFSGKTAPQVKEDVKRDFFPALIVEGGVWPIIQVANFRYVPVRYQLLYVNLFCLLDSCFLSLLEQQQGTPWKQWLNSFLQLKEK